MNCDVRRGGNAWLAAYFAFGQMQAANGAVQTALKQLEATDRAWLRAEALLAGPFSYESDGKSIQIKATIKLKNVGHAVASHISFQVGLYAEQPGTMGKSIRERNAACESLRQTAKDTRLLVFPDDTHDYTVTLNTAAPALEPQIVPRLPVVLPAMFIPGIGGCVDYQFLGSTAHHQTGFMYQVWWPNPQSGPNAFHPFGPDARQVPVEAMTLGAHPLGGFYAD